MMGNNARCKIAGIGRIRIKMFDGTIRPLDEVRHVPNLKRNIISLSTLDLKRYKYTDEYRLMEVSKGTRVVMKGRRKSKLHILQGSTESFNIN